MSEPGCAPGETVDAMMARARSLESASPVEAGRLYAQALRAAPGNLEAHNALERLGAPERYGEWMLVNCVIDPRDDIFHFFANHELAANPVREYLADGWRTLSELLLLMDALGKPLTSAGSVLEFAAGFGRFTRHLARALPGRVTVSDIHPGSVDFLRAQFAVEGFYSSHDPHALVIPGRYDLVFVLSMFTHLPPARWGPWLRRIARRALRPAVRRRRHVLRADQRVARAGRRAIRDHLRDARLGRGGGARRARDARDCLPRGGFLARPGGGGSPGPSLTPRPGARSIQKPLRNKH